MAFYDVSTVVIILFHRFASLNEESCVEHRVGREQTAELGVELFVFNRSGFRHLIINNGASALLRLNVLIDHCGRCLRCSQDPPTLEDKALNQNTAPALVLTPISA